ncbi:MAG TPA: hypothetical protein VGP16_13590 [Asanoa sp.]|nr:hypothetical protein [Asanoa sp.]
MADRSPSSGSGEPVLAWLERRAGRQQQSLADFDDPRLEYRR